jgi:hypothetical protein
LMTVTVAELTEYRRRTDTSAQARPAAASIPQEPAPGRTILPPTLRREAPESESSLGKPVVPESIDG